MSVFQRLAQIAAPYRGNLIAGLCITVVTTFLNTVVITMLFGMLVFMVLGPKTGADYVFFNIDFKLYLNRLVHSTNQIHLLVGTALLTGIIIFIKSLLEARQGYLVNRFAMLMGRELRQRMFNQIIRFSPEHFETENTGASLSRITTDVAALQSYLGQTLLEVVIGPLTVLMALVAMFVLNWQLTLITLVLAPIIGVIIGIAGRKTRKLALRIQEFAAELNAGLVERISHVRTVQSFAREDYETAHMQEQNQRYHRSIMRNLLVSQILSPAVEMVATIGMVSGVAIGGVAVLSGKMNGPVFATFLFMAQKAGEHFKRIAQINQVRQLILGTSERIFQILDKQSEIVDQPEAQPLSAVVGHVSFEHVSFRYTTGPDVLTDVDFSVNPGEVVALVGPSGAGKTTIINILPRFYDPISGIVRIDGQDIRTVTLHSLREQIGTVPQEPALFSGSIFDNIQYGRLEATEDEVIDAARAANALEFIERLPQGFATIVGERGMLLSGGQRQRVAIARAVLKNPRILILDEATSALDTKSERLVQEALERLMVGRTSFVIAHRLSTVRHATRILVLEQGRIVEMGTHDELLTRDGLYRKLHDLQFRTGEPLYDPVAVQRQDPVLEGHEN